MTSNILSLVDSVMVFGEIGAVARITISQDVQTRFPVQLAFAKFLSKIKGTF